MFLSIFFFKLQLIFKKSENITLLICFSYTAVGFSHFKPLNYSSPIISSFFFQKPIVNFSFKSSTLNVNSIEGSGKLKVYTIIANEVLSLNN